LSAGRPRTNSYGTSPCRDCSDNCCRKFFIILEDIKDRDWMKWLSFHQGVTVEKLGGKRIKVWFNYPCAHVLDDGSCAVYQNRPRMCREFTCEKLGSPESSHKKRGWFG
jgi:uncharacterized protein